MTTGKTAEKADKAEKAKTGKTGSARIEIRLVKSGICTPKDQKATLKGLGFRRLGQQVVREDSPAIRGMIRKVRHLVEVTTAETKR